MGGVLELFISPLVGLVVAALGAAGAYIFGGSTRWRRRLEGDITLLPQLGSRTARAELRRSITDRSMILLSRTEYPRVMALDLVLAGVIAALWGYGVAMAVVSFVDPGTRTGMGPSELMVVPLSGLLMPSLMMFFAFRRLQASMAARAGARLKFVDRHVMSPQSVANEIIASLYWARMGRWLVTLGCMIFMAMGLASSVWVFFTTQPVLAVVGGTLGVGLGYLTSRDALGSTRPVRDFYEERMHARDAVGEELFRLWVSVLDERQQAPTQGGSWWVRLRRVRPKALFDRGVTDSSDPSRGPVGAKGEGQAGPVPARHTRGRGGDLARQKAEEGNSSTG